MRKSIFAAVLALCLLGASVAYAANAVIDFKVNMTPTDAGNKKKPHNEKLRIDILTESDDPSVLPPATQFTDVYFDKNLKFNGAKFPSCTRTILEAEGPSGCPKNSVVGTIEAAALVGSRTSTEELKGNIVNMADGKGVFLYLKGETPVPLTIVLEGKLSSSTGLYGKKLSVEIPQNYREPAPNLKTPLIKFKTTTGKQISKGGKKIGYIESTGCTGGKWNFKGVFKFDDGTPDSEKLTTSKCKK